MCVGSRARLRADAGCRAAARAVFSVARSTLGYRSGLQPRDAPALVVMRELAGQYLRYGYRKIRIFSRAGESR